MKIKRSYCQVIEEEWQDFEEEIAEDFGNPTEAGDTLSVEVEDGRLEIFPNGKVLKFEPGKKEGRWLK